MNMKWLQKYRSRPAGNTAQVVTQRVSYGVRVRQTGVVVNGFFWYSPLFPLPYSWASGDGCHSFPA